MYHIFNTIAIKYNTRLQVTLHDGYATLDLIESKNGNGYKTMNELCRLLDTHKLPCSLLIKKTDIERLRKWYERFGFKTVEGRVMMRSPLAII